jgi:hypothetical protein
VGWTRTLWPSSLHCRTSSRTLFFFLLFNFLQHGLSTRLFNFNLSSSTIAFTESKASSFLFNCLNRLEEYWSQRIWLFISKGRVRNNLAWLSYYIGWPEGLSLWRTFSIKRCQTLAILHFSKLRVRIQKSSSLMYWFFYWWFIVKIFNVNFSFVDFFY